MIVLGLGGFAAAVGLTLGALALAGDEVGTVVQPNLAPSRAESASRSPSPSRDDSRSAEPSPSADDHGGSGSGDPASSDDHSGSGGSGDSGSEDNSGSGSDDSSGSGSGSDDD